MKITTLHSVDTEYSADSVEWCTEDELHSGYFACGTYQLVETAETKQSDVEATPNQARKGRIYLYGYDADTNALDKLQSLETAAILDMKWLPRLQEDQGPLLATVTGLGEIEIYELSHAERKLHRRTCLSLRVEQSTEPPPPLALALDWQREGTTALQLLVSDSKGCISHLGYTALGELCKLHTWKAHEFEAWTCAFDRWSPQQVYTGGDDALLHSYDLRTNQRIWTNKTHSAGVTCLLSHPRREHQLLTGSYDEVLRLFDTRFMKRCLSEILLNGGIWRLKPHPLREDLILGACMYKNFSVVGLGNSGADMSLLGTYDEHTSICYGADWAPSLGKQQAAEQQLLHMATCSFYDHKLCVSSVQFN